jgi:hypothetical protein
MFVEGLQNSDRGYINFGRVGDSALGAMSGGNLTWRGNRVWDASSLVYSQGTWTPRLMGFNNWVSGIAASTGGRYVRMGNIVHVNGHITLSSKNGMAGNLGIVDLPFACGGENSAGSVGIALNQSTSMTLELHIDPGSNIAYIMKASHTILTADSVQDTLAVYGFQITYSLS